MSVFHNDTGAAHSDVTHRLSEGLSQREPTDLYFQLLQQVLPQGSHDR